MIVIRKSGERGHADYGWLKAFYTFSFANYYDPEHMEFRALRVLNDDIIEPGKGFPTHHHNDMEVVTYILKGSLKHKDSTGEESVITRGDVQRMTTGTGIMHSEYNPSETKTVHLFQTWIVPEETGLTPSYEQKNFPEEEKKGKLCLIASSDGRGNSVIVRQDVNIYASILDGGDTIEQKISAGRHAWVQVAYGEISLNGQTLAEGDGAAVSDEEELKIICKDSAEFLLYDLA